MGGQRCYHRIPLSPVLLPGMCQGSEIGPKLCSFETHFRETKKMHFRRLQRVASSQCSNAHREGPLIPLEHCAICVAGAWRLDLLRHRKNDEYHLAAATLVWRRSKTKKVWRSKRELSRQSTKKGRKIKNKWRRRRKNKNTQITRTSATTLLTTNTDNSIEPRNSGPKRWRTPMLSEVRNFQSPSRKKPAERAPAIVYLTMSPSQPKVFFLESPFPNEHWYMLTLPSTP